MDQALIRRFLDGNVNEVERQECESYLSNPDAVVKLTHEQDDDSLLQTLKTSCIDTPTDDLSRLSGEVERLQQIADRAQQLVPTPAISLSDIQAILSPAQQDDELGRMGRFRVLEFIASGGMGLVFRAEDPELDRTVCLKLLHPKLATHADAKRRFEREARAAARMQHERIVTVFEVGQHNETPFLVMELLEGESLRQRLSRDRRVDIQTAKQIAIQIAEGLRYAHARGFLHRDIKPDNVWITTDGNVKLLDLGLARAIDSSMNLTHDGTIVGTPSYMSPEQVEGKTLAETSDLFSLGTVLFEMLTGVSPFDRPNVFSTMLSVAKDSLPSSHAVEPVELPREFADLVTRLLNKNPSERPQSADEVLQLLKHDELPFESKPQLQTSSWLTSRVTVVVATAICMVLLFASLFALAAATDKGVLVVEASEDVELQLQDGVLTVTDPQSEKTYTVRIGEKSLPSGVYQLELNDESSGLTLSSEIITIRRGEKQLVRVTLKPSSDVMGDERVADTDASTDDSLVNAAPFKLADLPALDAEETERALGLNIRDAISPFAFVSDPRKLDGVRSWSIEPTVGSKQSDRFVELSPNGEHLAICRADTGIFIYNSNLEVSHFAPIPDTVQDLIWAPDSQTFAASCFGDHSRSVVIYRLNGDDVEVVQTIPGSPNRIAWKPDGTELALQNVTEIRFYNMADGRSFEIPGNRWEGMITHQPWSQDGKMFAWQLEDVVNVWSLEERRMIHSFPAAANPSFTNEGHNLIIEKGDTFECWDMNDVSRVNLVRPGSEWQSSTHAIDPNGETLYGILPNGQLASNQSVEPLLDFEIESRSWSGSLCLSLDGQRIAFAGRVLVLMERTAEGRFAIIAKNDRFSASQLPEPESGSFSDGSLFTRRWVIEEIRSRKLKQVMQNEATNLLEIQNYNLRDHTVSSSFDSPDNYDLRLEWPSPTGQKLLMLTSSPDIYSREPGQLYLLDYEKQSTQELGVGLTNVGITWSSDGKYLVIPATNDSVREPGELIILDSTNGNRRHLKEAPSEELRWYMAPAPGRKRFPTFVVGESHVYIVALKYEEGKENSTSTSLLSLLPETVLLAYELDFDESEVVQPSQIWTLGIADGVENCLVQGNTFVWTSGSDLSRRRASQLPRSRGNQAEDSADNRLFESKRYAMSLDSGDIRGFDLTPLERSSRFPAIEHRLSYGGGYLATISTTNDRPVDYFITDLSAGSADETAPFQYLNLKPVFRDKPRTFSNAYGYVPCWHPQREVVAYLSDYRIVWYDAEAKREFSYERKGRYFHKIIPTDFGWIATTSLEYLAFDLDGNYLGSWMDTAERNPNDFYSAQPTRWIAADGGTSGAKEATGVRVIQLRGNKLITTSLDEFRQEFPEELADPSWPWTSDESESPQE